MVLKTFFPQWLIVFGLFACLSGCTPRPAQFSSASSSAAAGILLVDQHGRDVPFGSLIGDAPFTVVEFFSAHCPCQRAHDPRLREIYDAFSPRGVKFVAVDTEAGASPERVAKEAQARGYPYPLLADPTGKLAEVFGVTIAMHTVIFDREGRVRYSGGLDSNRTHLKADATFYVRDALEDLVSGREPRIAHGKALGCVLQH